MTLLSTLRSTSWGTPVGLYLFAVGVNLIGITWGLPSQGSDLLPSPAQGAVVEEADQAWATAQDPARNLNFGPPAPDRPETTAKVLRRFALYTADPDEVVALMAVARLNPLAGRWDPGFAQYGGFFLYALGGTFKVAGLLRLVALRGDPSFYVLRPERIARLYLVGRLLVVLIGALSIPLLWSLAIPLYGEPIAAAAATLAACSPAWIAWNHVMKPVAFGAAFAIGALVAAQRLPLSSRPWRATALAGLLTGLAAGAVLHYALLILGPWIGIALQREDPVRRRLARMLVAAAVAALVVIALNPSWILNPGGALAGWAMVSGWYEPSVRPAALAGFVWGSLGPGLGLPLVVAGALEGLLLLWRVREALPVVAPAFAFLAAAAIKTGGVPGDGLHARLVLPAILVLAVLGAGGLFRLGRALPRSARWLPLVLVIPTLLVAIALLRNFTAAGGPAGTRQRAGAWINALPQGAAIGILAPLAPFRSAYFRLDRFPLVVNDHPEVASAAPDPDYFLVAERSDVPAAPNFQARYQEVQRFAPPALPLERSARVVYPFADPPIRIYARRANPG